eukprot:m.53419 g.53419  ORF g.53419 m.53419 type:complete len:64 (+) comp18391_c0_seq1:502-693(+)
MGGFGGRSGWTFGPRTRCFVFSLLRLRFPLSVLRLCLTSRGVARAGGIGRFEDDEDDEDDDDG